MTKVGLFYHDMRNLKKKKKTHIMVNDSRSPIPQVEKKTKQYTTRDVKRSYRARLFQNITGQPVNKILNAIDYNTL